MAEKSAALPTRRVVGDSLESALSLAPRRARAFRSIDIACHCPRHNAPPPAAKRMFGMPTLGKALLWLGTSVFILKCREGPRNIVVARYGYDGLPPSRVLGGFSFLGLCSLKIKFRRKASLNFLSRGKPYLVRGHLTHTKVASNSLNSTNYPCSSSDVSVLLTV